MNTPPPMPEVSLARTVRPLVAAALGLTAGLAAAPASAQIDINPPMPNVLLLVDTSGSMEYNADGSQPVCTPNGASDMNRWATVVSVLTGSIENRSCYAQDRSSTGFINEYSLLGKRPYDAGYFLPFHRILSNGCTPGPGALPLNVFDFPLGGVRYHPYNSTILPCALGNTFKQANDGLLDVYADRVRFGLMTFDSVVHSGTGLLGGVFDSVTGMNGAFSYYKGWRNSSGGPATGHPPACSPESFEVGARNAAAPPWEGRMVAFGPPDASATEVRSINEQIQETIVATRPYGATPIDGMMSDVYTFFREDNDDNPLDPTKKFAPAEDPLFKGGCRKSYVILLSDGEPNLDLRPYCSADGGKCPFEKQSWEIAHDLANPPAGVTPVLTYTVGFGLSSESGTNCNAIDEDDFKLGGMCTNPTGALRGCCTLARIAIEGGTERAFFADNLTELNNALSTALANIAGGATSRTLPTFASASATAAGTGGAPAVAYQFTSSFTPRVGALWSGNLERHRWVCSSPSPGDPPVPSLEPVDTSRGDDFAANINNDSAGRRFITVIGDTQGGSIHSTRSIRPSVAGVPDGVGAYGGAQQAGSRTDITSLVQGAPAAMGMVPMPTLCSEPVLGASTSAGCAALVMNWELGGVNPSLPASRANDQLGAIYHATPFVHGAPRAFLANESYSLYAEANAGRPLMLYAATTDGQLHAFKVAPGSPTESVKADQLASNELWSFLPPHVLPNIISQYPNNQQLLLDGPPVVRDVVFSRSADEAAAANAQWRTVLLGGGGAGGGFYYALDVSDPNNPLFLWQLSETEAGEKLFGSQSGTPAIATIAMLDGATVREVAVAILPGGSGRSVPATTCARDQTVFDYLNPDDLILDPSDETDTINYAPRSTVRCWEAGAGRSLTIVRLSDGKVLRRFQGRDGDGPPGLLTTLVTNGGFDAPLTGIPVPFPSDTGQVANRIYVGDADGALWRVDLSDVDPAAWNVKLAFDAYPASLDGPLDGEPISTPPIIAVDGIGNTVVIFSTGDQEQFTQVSSAKTRLWSLREVPQASASAPFSIKVNWFLPFENGQRVTGPISVFDEVAYFATFTPQDPNAAFACADGNGSIWGVDFLKRETTVTGPRPLPRLPDPSDVTKEILEIPEPPGTVVFGVSVTQQPNCFEVDDATVDPYIGANVTITSSSAPVFALVYQTGQGGTAAQGAKTKTDSIVLPAPAQRSRVDSWASIVE